MVLVTPGERTRYRALLRALKRDGPLPAFPTVETAVAEARRRLSLAKRLDKIAHARQRDAADAEWREANAAELGIELDSDEDADADAVLVFNAADKKAKTKMAQKAHRAFERAKAREARRVSLGRGGEILRVRVRTRTRRISPTRAWPSWWTRGSTRTTRPRPRAWASTGGWAGRRQSSAATSRALKTPLGVKAERRAGVASARYPSRGEGAARMARASAREERHTRVARRARDGRHEGCVRGGHAEGGGEGCARVGAAPGGAAGKNENAPRGAPGDTR